MIKRFKWSTNNCNENKLNATHHLNNRISHTLYDIEIFSLKNLQILHFVVLIIIEFSDLFSWNLFPRDHNRLI